MINHGKKINKQLAKEKKTTKIMEIKFDKKNPKMMKFVWKN
jgi:hypothetical protein